MESFIKRLLLYVLCPLLLSSCLAGSHDSSSPLAKGNEDLDGHSVACLAGSLVDIGFEKIAPGAEKLIFNNISDLLTALKNGKAQYMMVDSIAVVGIDRSIH